MKYQDHSPQDVHPRILVNRLAKGWSIRGNGVLDEFLRRWEHKVDTKAEIVALGPNTLVFIQDISYIHLRGMHKVPCVVLGGAFLDPAATDQLRKTFTPAVLPFILTLSEGCYQQATHILPKDRCLILTPDQIVHILISDERGLILKNLLWQQIPKIRLSPYNLLQPAEGGMFFGRENEVARLIDEETTSFAIAGPGRIGKTSLLKRYRHDMLRRRDLRSGYRFMISFFDCQHTSSDRIARFVAMNIAPSAKSDKMNTDGLVKFLQYCSKDGPLDLLLDEVDLVCDSDAFKALGAAARLGYCRLVLSGRGVLLKSMLSPKNPLECRMDLIQLGPLDHSSAYALLSRPFADMNLGFSEPDLIADQVLRFTGRLPHQLQLFCMKLMDLAIKGHLDTISVDQIEIVKQDFVVAQYFINPVLTVEDPEARLIGLLLLRRGKRKFSITDVQEIASRVGLQRSFERVLDICNELVINNVLSWAAGSYQIATEGLFFYAHQMNYLDNAVYETYQILRNQRRVPDNELPEDAL